MNIFVLTAGRSGSLTFAKACAHLANYTAGHETRAHLLPPERLNYPDNHIEVDNRLAWFLGELGQRYDSKGAFYVHLIRDEEETAQSLLRHSLPTPERPVVYPANVLRAYAHGLVMQATQPPDYYPAAIAYVRTVNANIREYLSSRLDVYWQPRRPSMVVQVGDPDSFGRFLERIKAEGALGAAMETWGRKHNESRRSDKLKDTAGL